MLGSELAAEETEEDGVGDEVDVEVEYVLRAMTGFEVIILDRLPAAVAVPVVVDDDDEVAPTEVARDKFVFTSIFRVEFACELVFAQGCWSDASVIVDGRVE